MPTAAPSPLPDAFAGQRFTVSPRVLCQEVAGEAVLLDLDSEKYFGLNTVGLRIWQLLQQGQEPAAILRALEREYDADAATLAADLQDLIQRLGRAGLVSASR
jgi:hypothetical protein